MDVVGRPLNEVIADFESAKIPYEVTVTKPTRDFFKVDAENLYVVRQTANEQGCYFLTVAAKMRKEVFEGGLRD